MSAPSIINTATTAAISSITPVDVVNYAGILRASIGARNAILAESDELSLFPQFTALMSELWRQFYDSTEFKDRKLLY